MSEIHLGMLLQAYAPFLIVAFIGIIIGTIGGK